MCAVARLDSQHGLCVDEALGELGHDGRVERQRRPGDGVAGSHRGDQWTAARQHNGTRRREGPAGQPRTAAAAGCPVHPRRCSLPARTMAFPNSTRRSGLVWTRTSRTPPDVRGEAMRREPAAWGSRGGGKGTDADDHNQSQTVTRACVVTLAARMQAERQPAMGVLACPPAGHPEALAR